MVRGWARTLMHIAEQEMLHLALVQNLLTAVGAAPHLSRPNFPVPPRAFPARIQIALLPFGEEALRHFASSSARRRGSTGRSRTRRCSPRSSRRSRCPTSTEDQIGPIVADFATISHLYRSHRGWPGAAGRADGGGEAVHRPRERPGDRRALPLPGARGGHEPGVGSRGDRDDRRAGRGRPRGVAAVALRAAAGRCWSELVAAQAADPSFDPTRPVLAAHVRPPESGVSVPLISCPLHRPGHGPAQRRVRGGAAGAGALLQPDRRVGRAAGDARATSPCTSWRTSSHRWAS